MLLERDISEPGKDGYQIISHNMLINMRPHVINSEHKIVCSSLGNHGILTYIASDLKIDNNILLASVPDVVIIASHICGSDNYIVGLGSKSGKIFVSEISRGETWSMGELCTVINFNNKAITHLTFADEKTLIVVVDNAKMHILRMDDKHELANKELEPLELKLPCKGMKIDGLKSDNEHKLLSKLIAAKAKS
jgi:hypothetical protein